MGLAGILAEPLFFIVLSSVDLSFVFGAPVKVCVPVCSIKVAGKIDGQTRYIRLIDRYAFPQRHNRTLQNDSVLPIFPEFLPVLKKSKKNII